MCVRAADTTGLDVLVLRNPLYYLEGEPRASSVEGGISSAYHTTPSSLYSFCSRKHVIGHFMPLASVACADIIDIMRQTAHQEVQVFL